MKQSLSGTYFLALACFSWFHYDQTKHAIQKIVDIPDRQIDLFIRFCLQNNGRLSTRKRENHFNFLSDDEVEKMEKAIQTSYGPG